MEFALPIRHQVGLRRCRRWGARKTGRHKRSPRGRPWPPGGSPGNCGAPPPRRLSRIRALSPTNRAKSRSRRRGRSSPGELTSSWYACGMVSATSKAADTSRLTRSQSSDPTLADRGRPRPHTRDRGGIDEEAHHPARRFTAGLDFDQIEARVANVGLGEQPQVLNVLSHAGCGVLVVSGSVSCSVSVVRTKKKGGHAAHPSSKEATQFQGRVL